MLHDGIIQPSHSPWTTPMVLVPKKNGTLRICIDYCKLNAVTRPDPFPIPRIDDLLDGMSSAKFITTLDLARGYWQVSMDPASRERTAFSTDFVKYEFRVMPFGLVGAPTTFQRLMNELFVDLYGMVAAYMDDLAIYSMTLEDHIAHLRETVGKLPATVNNFLSAWTVPRHSSLICSLSSTNPRPSPIAVYSFASSCYSFRDVQ